MRAESGGLRKQLSSGKYCGRQQFSAGKNEADQFIISLNNQWNRAFYQKD